MNQSLLICICTYRREELLAQCLQSLRSAGNVCRVLVVDNADSGACREICRQYEVDYVAEKDLGLSKARNRGLQECQEDWILYLDDDATVRKQTIEYLKKRVNTAVVSIAAIGGRYEHYYRKTPPAWIKQMAGVGNSPDDGMSDYGPLPADSYLSGGIFCVRLSALLAVDGFRSRMGMQGSKMAYGEEDDVQDRLRTAGYTIAYAPEVVIDHLYHERKFSLATQLRMRYAYGIANRRRGTTRSWLAGLCACLFYRFPYHLGRWLIKHRDWAWQRVLLELFGPLAYWWGTVPPVFKGDDRG
ncbi:hypothetical protein CEQ90_04445 [Lewinellaceae bacterium SD302]|nr:hypothetical protein CEQ90_04445 [Lewinellaceae bacterium SD302]